MARVKSFRGVRPKKELADLVAELPYDVVSINEARERAKDNRYNFFHISLPEIDLPEGANFSDDLIYEKGRENLERFLREGVLRQDDSPLLYLYSMVMNGRMQTGLAACVHADDYTGGKIKKHELVLKDKLKDRINHIDRLNANTGPVYLFFKDEGQGRDLFKDALKIEPEYDFTAKDGIRHILRIIKDQEMIKAFAEILKDSVFYIADGHHRAASAVKVAELRRSKNPEHGGEEEYNWFLAVIFPHDQLRILAYNRVVRDLNGYSKEGFLERIEESFIVEKARNSSPSQSHEIYMYLEGTWYSLKPGFSIDDDPVRSLDAQILQDTILDPVLGIKKPTEDKRISFIGGIKGEKALEEAVDSGEFSVAFSLYPVSIKELISVSDAEKLMPPKSTWFEPKLRSGLVVHLL